MAVNLEKLFAFGAETAKFLFEKQGYLVPMWIGIDERGAHKPLIVHNMVDKDAVSDAVRTWLKRDRIVAYTSMLECWVYEGKEIPPEIREGRSLEQNPDRREAIHLLAEDKDGNSISGGMFILRPEHGKPKTSPVKRHPADATAEGRFASMFT